MVQILAFQRTKVYFLYVSLALVGEGKYPKERLFRIRTHLINQHNMYLIRFAVSFTVSSIKLLFSLKQ